MNFTPREDEIIKSNYDKTIFEIEALLLREGYRRSRKSINRKIEKLREANAVGHKSKETLSRSYRMRGKKAKVAEESSFDDFATGGPGFDNGEGSFKGGDAGFDNGEAGWDSGEDE